MRRLSWGDIHAARTTENPHHVMHHAVRRVAIVAAVCVPLLTPHAPLSAQQRILSQSLLYDTAQVRQLERENAAQLTPSAVLIDTKTKVATVTITNPLDAELNVALKLQFYTVKTDTAGRLVSTIDSTPGANTPSLTSWVKDLPAQITLGPKKTETITLHLDVPDAVSSGNSSSGEYWAQLVATSPAIKRELPVVIRRLIENPGGEPRLVQQPAKGNLTVGMVSTAKLIYRPTAATASSPKPTVTLGAASGRMLPDGQVEVCAPLQYTASTSLYGSARLSLQTSEGRDTVVARQAFEIPAGSDTQLRPCFQGMVPGGVAHETKVTLTIDAKHTKFEQPVSVPFPDAHVTATVQPAATLASTSAGANAHAATTNESKKPSVPLVEVVPTEGALADQLRHEAEQAAKEGKVALVEVGAEWCGPCRIFLRSLSDSLMIDALQNARVVRIDFDHWGQAFVNSGYKVPPALPSIFILNKDGSQGPSFDVNRWQPLASQYGTLDARSMAPPLKEFISEIQNQKGASPSAPHE